MASGEKLTIQMTGGSPWGFRLYGGDDDALVVAKLRKRSKAHDAGLMEGDALLGINGYSCHHITHGTAMSLIESASDLSLIILRGATDKNAVNAAIQALGTELQPVTAAVKAASQTTSGIRLSPAPSPINKQQTNAENKHQVINGYTAPERYAREEQTYKEGDATTHVITETSREQFGGTTVTKVKRETVTQYGQKPMFNVSNVAVGKQSSPAPKPGVWTPPGGGARMTVSAPSGVQVQHNPDQSVTMTIGLHGSLEETKENIAPQQPKLGMPPMFKVSKFGDQPEEAKPKPAVWTPSAAAPAKAPAPAPAPAPRAYGGDTSADDGNIPLLPDEEAELKAHLESLQKPLPSILQKVLTDGSGSDREGTPDSPGYLTRRRIEQFASDYETEEERNKRKIFADSAFYDDPEHKYPTIEEQVKMARKVAMSLLAPANKKARGHRMFLRRMVKSQKWTTDQDKTEKDFEWENDEEEEKYYNPNPWSAAAPKWEPPKQADAIGKKIPPPPPVPTNIFQAPTLPVGRKKEEKTKALSAEEFEKMRLFEAKSDHTQVSPAVCFSLAEDLRKMKGKGGKLFAKRVARAEKWVVDDNPTASKPNPELIQKIAMQAAAGGAMPMPGMGPAAVAAAPQKREEGPVVNRLKDMIDPPKPKMSPWEAAATHDGNVEKAFDHLKGYNPYGRSITGELASSLDTATQKGAYTAPPAVAPATTSNQPAKMPDYTRKIKPWNASDQASSAAGASFSSPAAAPRPLPAESSPGSGTGFRPVNFRLATGGASSLPAASSSAMTSGGEAASIGGGGGGEDIGYCDL